MKHVNKIVYYDFNDINYSSFYLTGFMQNAKQFNYNFVVSKKAPRLLSCPEMESGWSKIMFSINLFKTELFGKEFYFCIDTRDSCEAGLDRGMGYHLPLLQKVDFYFKVNYNYVAIQDDPNLRIYSDKNIPILPFFPLRMPRIIPFMPRIKSSAALNWTKRDTFRRLKTLKNMISLEEIIKMRNQRKELDLFFVMNYYGQKVHSAEDEFRYQIMEEIKKHRNVISLTGFTFSTKLTGKFSDYQIKRFPLKDYLNNLARSKVGIYVKGVHNCLSFKFGQLLSLGLPIVGQALPNNKENLYTSKYFKDQFAFNDPKEIVQQAINLLDDADKMKTMGMSNASVFDSRFNPKAVVSELLKYLMANVHGL